MSKQNNESGSGGDKIISGARTGGRIFETVFKWCIGCAAFTFAGAAASYAIGEARCNYLNNKRKENKNG